jgi:hypothetical protein
MSVVITYLHELYKAKVERQEARAKAIAEWRALPWWKRLFKSCP